MATIDNIKGSALFGSPIDVILTSASPAGDITFHQIKVEVTARLQNGSDRTYTFTKPVSNSQQVYIDISTALQAAFSSYVYTATPPTYYPYVVFSIKARDEYVLNGEEHQTTWATSAGHRALAGAFSDMERMLAGDTGRSTSKFSRKPSTTPEIVMVGDTHIRPADMSVVIGNISHGQQSLLTTITMEGLQTVNGVQVYAVPAGDTDRYQFRFINGLGAMESLSVRTLISDNVDVQTNKYVLARHETFGTFSRGATANRGNHEVWKMTSGPVDEAWQSWYIHEFLMSSLSWICIPDRPNVWIPCHILPDETVTGISRKESSMLEVDFSVQMDVEGPILSSISV